MGIISVPITKAKASRDIDTDSLPDAVYQEALLLGLKELANRGTSKLTKASVNGDEAKLKDEASKIADKQIELMLAGDIRFSTKQVEKKASGVVMTEAMRLARNVVKDQLKAAKIKISHVDAKDITAAAKELVGADPSFIEQATANIEARKAKPAAIDITALVKVNPKKVAKAEADKAAARAEAEKVLSSKQAGIPTKSKPKAQVPA